MANTRFVVKTILYSYLFNTMSIRFIESMDISVVLLLRSFLNHTDEVSCSILCRSMQKRSNELYDDLLIGYTQRQLVIDKGRFWKSFDLDFQMKDRERWDMMVKAQLLSESNRYRREHFL